MDTKTIISEQVNSQRIGQQTNNQQKINENKRLTRKKKTKRKISLTREVCVILCIENIIKIMGKKKHQKNG